MLERRAVLPFIQTILQYNTTQTVNNATKKLRIKTSCEAAYFFLKTKPSYPKKR